MLNYFPRIYPGEALYSAIARYHSVSLIESSKDILEDIFGDRTIVATLEFPSHLKYFSDTLTYEDKNTLLYNNTLYPLYKPFLFKDDQKAIEEMMLGHGGMGIKGRIGFLAGSVMKRKHLYYCPECLKEDLEMYGESYFRSTHQMQGNLVCSKHNVVLEKYPITQKYVGRVKFIRLDEQVVSEVQPRANTDEHLSAISFMYDEVMDGALNGYSASDLKEIYLRKLKEGYLLTFGADEVNYTKLNPMIYEFYGTNFLVNMESMIDPLFESSWIRKLLRTKKVKVHPLRHLLFIRLLFGGIEDMVKYAEKPQAMTKYPCLNKVCEYYSLDVITDVVITADFKTREPVGTFRCTECGYTYSRKMAGNIYKIGRVKEFGDKFIQEVSRVSRRTDMSLREKAKHMGCDPGTVKKFM